MRTQKRIDEKMARFSHGHLHPAKRIVLSPKAIDNFVSELQNYAAGEFDTAMSVYTCPHCGKSLLTYAGCPVEAMTDKDVMIE